MYACSLCNFKICEKITELWLPLHSTQQWTFLIQLLYQLMKMLFLTTWAPSEFFLKYKVHVVCKSIFLLKLGVFFLPKWKRKIICQPTDQKIKGNTKTGKEKQLFYRSSCEAKTWIPIIHFSQTNWMLKLLLTPIYI